MHVDSSIEVIAPVQAVYNQWTQFEEFPRFMEGVTEVEQVDDVRLHWQAEVAGVHKEWYARITRQVPDEVLAWEGEGNAGNSGTVVFHELKNGSTEVELHMDYNSDDLKVQVGAALGFLSRRVEADLQRFKDFVEERGTPTGAWRGEIIHGVSAGAASQLRAGVYDPDGRRSPDDMPRPQPPRHDIPTDADVTPDFEGATDLERGPEIPAGDDIRPGVIKENEAEMRRSVRSDDDNLPA